MILPKNIFVQGFSDSSKIRNIENESKSEWKPEGNYICFKTFCKHKDYKKSAPIIDNSLVYTNIVSSSGNQTYSSKVLRRIDVHKMSLKQGTWLVSVWSDHHLKTRNNTKLELQQLNENVIKKIWAPVVKLKSSRPDNIDINCNEILSKS